MSSVSAPDAGPSVRSSRSRLVPLVFTGRGGEYFRIWIVNLMLSILTLGVYSAWAKVRRLQYFHRNTHIAGSAFDYHARPLAILFGRMLSLTALALYVIASEFEPLAALVLVLLYLLALPWIVHRALRFRLLNTSWRGIRFGFDASATQAYRALGMPVLALLAVVASGAVLGWALEKRLLMASMLPLAMFGGYALVPLLHYRMKAFHHGNARLGTLEARFHARAGQFYGVYLRTIALAIGVVIAVAVLGMLLALIIGGGAGPLPAIGRRLEGPALILGGVLVASAGFWLAMSVLGPYFQSRLQNLVWNRTRIGSHRFVSAAGALPLWGISVVNLLLSVLTLGLFLPFAAIRVARYRLGAVQCAVLGDLDRIDAASRERVAALGEEMVDLLDIDIGL